MSQQTGARGQLETLLVRSSLRVYNIDGPYTVETRTTAYSKIEIRKCYAPFAR